MPKDKSRWMATDAALPIAIEVLKHGPISRNEVARRVGLTRGSLSRLTAPLLSTGLLLEVGELSDGKVGRPTQLLDVDPDSHFFVGIKLRENELTTALTNLRGSIIRSRVQPFDDNSPGAVTELIAHEVREVAQGVTVTGIGIGIGGLVRNREVVTSAHFLGWHDVALAHLISEATGIATMVENDAIAFTEYEHWFGEGKTDERFAVVTLGTGIGFGLVMNGAVVLDEEYGRGAVSHWPLRDNGPLCQEGHHGCATGLLHAEALSRQLSDVLGRTVSYQEVIRLAQGGQPAALRLVEEAGTGIGRLLAGICSLTMPQRIIIGGEGVELARIAWDAIHASMRADRVTGSRTPPIVITSGDNAEWCRGAAVLAITAFVQDQLPRPRE